MGTLKIIAGTVYGNAQHVAEQVEENLAEQGVDCELESDPSVEDFTEVASKNNFVVVDFWATWCAPCKAMAPIYESVAGVGREGVAFVKVDIDECDELAAKFDVRNLPTFMVIKGEETLESKNGRLTAEAMSQWIDGVVTKHSDVQIDDDF